MSEYTRKVTYSDLLETRNSDFGSPLIKEKKKSNRLINLF